MVTYVFSLPSGAPIRLLYITIQPVGKGRAAPTLIFGDYVWMNLHFLNNLSSYTLKWTPHKKLCLF
jgi:hypothetical protein